MVWVDYNANGLFENEEVIVEEINQENQLIREIIVPMTATVGLTRMRILYSAYTDPVPCDSWGGDFGEAEDYCLNIKTFTNVEDNLENRLDEILVYPNPFKNSIRFGGDFPLHKTVQIKIFNVLGEAVEVIEDFNLRDEINLSSIARGVYFLRIKDDSNVVRVVKMVKEF